MFGRQKKVKKSSEQLAKEREERLVSASNEMKVIIAALEAKKPVLIGKVSEARKLGLPTQEQMFRKELKRCLAEQKRVRGMLLTLEAAAQSRDIAGISGKFAKCLDDIARDMEGLRGSVDVKKGRNNIAKIMYVASEQARAVDELIDAGSYAEAAAYGDDAYTEFDDEVDSMLAQFETGTVTVGSTQKNKQGY